MKNRIGKVKKFVSEHRTEIMLGACIIGVGMLSLRQIKLEQQLKTTADVMSCKIFDVASHSLDGFVDGAGKTIFADHTGYKLYKDVIKESSLSYFEGGPYTLVDRI